MLPYRFKGIDALVVEAPRLVPDVLVGLVFRIDGLLVAATLLGDAAGRSLTAAFN